MSEESDIAWYCVRTLTKREFLASQILAQHEDVEVLCPRIRYKKVTKRGTIWWKEAMFPSYFFARFSVAENGRLVTHSQGVTGLVQFNRKVPSIPDAFIDELREQLASDDEEVDTLTLKPEISTGDEVEILHGPFSGQKASVSRVLTAEERVGVLLEFLGDTKEVEVDLYSLLLRKPQPSSSG